MEAKVPVEAHLGLSGHSAGVLKHLAQQAVCKYCHNPAGRAQGAESPRPAMEANSRGISPTQTLGATLQ